MFMRKRRFTVFLRECLRIINPSERCGGGREWGWLRREEREEWEGSGVGVQLACLPKEVGRG